MEPTYTSTQIEQAFLQWWKNWHLDGRPLDNMPEEKDFVSTAKKDAEYLIELINNTTPPHTC